jgi:hypothetical protein
MPVTVNHVGTCFFGCFMTIWTLVVIPFDVMAVYALVWQLRAVGFETAEGVIIRSGVRTEHGSDGPTHALDVAYNYEVDGRWYTGTRYSYGEMSTNTGAWQRVSAGLPVGKRVPVHYNPGDPDDAVLRVEPTGAQLLMLWFLAPFNVIVVGGWVYVRRMNRPEFDPADRRRVVATPGGWRVRLPGTGPLTAFGCVLGAFGFVGTFVWAFGWGANPPVPLIATASVLAVCAAGAVAVLSPHAWLEVNESERTLRFAGKAVAFDEVRSLDVEEEVRKDSDGDTTYRYHCEVVLPAGGPTPRLRLATFNRREGADAFAAWLRERLGPSVAPGLV